MLFVEDAVGMGEVFGRGVEWIWVLENVLVQFKSGQCFWWNAEVLGGGYCCGWCMKVEDWVGDVFGWDGEVWDLYGCWRCLKSILEEDLGFLEGWDGAHCWWCRLVVLCGVW